MQLAALYARLISPCQPARKRDPESASKKDPFECRSGCAVRLSIGMSDRRASGQSRPNPRGGSIAWSSERSSSLIVRSASAVAVSWSVSGRASSHASYSAATRAAQPERGCDGRLGVGAARAMGRTIAAPPVEPSHQEAHATNACCSNGGAQRVELSDPPAVIAKYWCSRNIGASPTPSAMRSQHHRREASLVRLHGRAV